ncbi:MAG: isochorismatase family cysteine hydrolase [Candidatus Dojkabacteria bacterium]
MTVYLVIDMIKGFTEPETSDGKCNLYIPGAKNIIKNINNHIINKKDEDYVLYVRDIHSEDDPEFKRFPPHCVCNTEEIQFDEDIYIAPYNSRIMNKHTIDAFYDTDLGKMIDCLKTDNNIVVMGCCTEYCVFAASVSALFLGYDVKIHKDCIVAKDPIFGECILEGMKEWDNITIVE